MGTFTSSSTDDRPTRCVICGEECERGPLCTTHQGIKVLAALVSEGRLGDWPADEGSEPQNHRGTMLTQPPVGPDAPPVVSWNEDLTRLARGYYYWQWVDD